MQQKIRLYAEMRTGTATSPAEPPLLEYAAGHRRSDRGHCEGTKSRLGHYKGQQTSTSGNEKATENALVSAESKRVEKVYTHVRDVGAASSNLVTSTIENARSFGSFPVAACFVLSGKNAFRALLGH